MAVTDMASVSSLAGACTNCAWSMSERPRAVRASPTHSLAAAAQG